jgi:hypothetical protein
MFTFSEKNRADEPVFLLFYKNFRFSLAFSAGGGIILPVVEKSAQTGSAGCKLFFFPAIPAAFSAPEV